MTDQKIHNTPAQDHEASLQYYMLYYKLVPDILTARIPYKEEHMRILHELSSRGLAFVGGEVKEGFPAVFMFEGKNEDVLQEWLTRDPYLNNNLVEEYRYNRIILVSGRLVSEKGLLRTGE
jgi:uncharacterized protein